MIPRRKNTNRYVTRRSSIRYIVYRRNLWSTSRHNTPSGCHYRTTGIEDSKLSEYIRRIDLDTLKEKGLETSLRQLKEARGDILRRPDPDVTGAVQHSRAAVECVARKVTGYPKKNLYQILKILKQHPDILPDHLAPKARKLWKDASNRGVHLSEGDEPTYAEAERVVVSTIVLCLYLACKIDNGDGS